MKQNKTIEIKCAFTDMLATDEVKPHPGEP